VNAMKITLSGRKGDKATMVIQGVTPAFANALRRIMISEVPTMAIDTVEFHENDSVLFDETISHRLGLIPLSADPEKFNRKGECKCGGKGCPSCQVIFALEKTGPGMAYSGDLKSSNKEVKPSSPSFPIAELLQGQSLKLEATAIMGTGMEHAKWQAANAYYQYYPELVVKNLKDARKCIRNCPKDLIVLKGEKPVLADPEKCDICKACLEGCEGIEVKGDPTRFIFRVESVSGLKPEQIIEKSIEMLEAKAESLRKELKKALD
jgi:DNA-directed RNA polymerase subunit D